MALDDFDSSDDELDLDVDLFDFPKTEEEPEAPVREEIEEFPQEVVEAAAAVQEEIDAQPTDEKLLGLDEDLLDEDLDLDLDALLGDEDLLGELESFDDLQAEVANEEPLDFDQLIPTAEPQQAAPTPEATREPEPDHPAPAPEPVAAPKEQPAKAAAPVAAAPAKTPTKAPAKTPAAEPAPDATAASAPELATAVAASGAASTGFSIKASWPLVAGILLFNVVILTLGLAAISSMSSSVDTFASKLGDVARELRETAPVEPVVIPVVETNVAPVEPAPIEVQTTRVKLPPYARGEIKAAQDEMDRGEYQLARRRLFRLLATIDDPLAEDAPEAEEQANLLIAETFVLEANNLDRSQR